MTYEQVRDLFDYREDGNLVWKVKPNKSIPIGAVAGLKPTTKEKYRRVKINGWDHALHRVIFLWHHGWLPKVVDHRNQNKFDNKIENLRAATVAQNTQNVNASPRGKVPYKGITHRPEKRLPWIVELRCNGKRVIHQSCKTLKEAKVIANEARRYFHGEFAAFDEDC